MQTSMRTTVASSKAFVRGVAVRARTTSARRAQKMVTMAKVCIIMGSIIWITKNH